MKGRLMPFHSLEEAARVADLLPPLTGPGAYAAWFMAAGSTAVGWKALVKRNENQEASGFGYD
jgi:hypothetical protein